jgi:hypothetical protein
MSQPSRPRVPGQGDAGILFPLLGITFAVLLVGFWPAMVWHGYGGPTGNDWRWDIHSTIAEAVYFGVIGFIAALVALGNRPAKAYVAGTVTPAGLRPPPASVVARPACRHLDAVPVDNLLGGEPWAWLCPDPPEGCGDRLPAEHGRLARPCCGSAPGTAHQYNCPHLKGSPA